jgi:predicted ATPase
MERLVITKFGQLENITFDVKDFTVLIGPQASGKSTIAKLIYFFKKVPDVIIEYYLNEVYERSSKNFSTQITAKLRKDFLSYFGSTLHLSELSIEYIYSNNLSLTLTLTQEKYLTPTFSRAFMTELYDIDRLFNDLIFKIDNIQSPKESLAYFRNISTLSDQFRRSLTLKINSIINREDEIIFIPSARSLLTILYPVINQIKSFEENSKSEIDKITSSFIQKIGEVRPFFGKRLDDIIADNNILTDFNISTQVIKIAKNKINSILKGEYRIEKDGEKIYLNNNQYVKINFASSGQQESLWILLLVFSIIIENRNVLIIIEEPEAHLFPEAQVEITELIALLAYKSKTKILVTTHSPYILGAFNNLIYAHEKGKTNPVEARKIIPEELWLDINRVFAGYLENGKLEDIIDTEINQIKNEMVDTASRKINSNYEELFDID